MCFRGRSVLSTRLWHEGGRPWRTLAAADVAAGRLVIPFDLTLPMELGFFFVCPGVAAERPKIVAFRDWLLEETSRLHPPVQP